MPFFLTKSSKIYSFMQRNTKLVVVVAVNGQGTTGNR